MLDAVQAEQVDMSIWLRSDGLTFAQSYASDTLGRQVPKGGEANSWGLIAQAERKLSRSAESVAQAYSELIYTEPQLALPYRSVRLYYTPLFSVIVPLELFRSSEAMHWLCLIGGQTFEGKEYQAVSYILEDEGKCIVSAVESQLAGLLSRTYLQLEYCPYFVPLIQERKPESRSRASRELNIALTLDGMDCFALQMGSLKLLNSFGWIAVGDEDKRLGELTYYIFAFWQNLGFDPLADSLHLSYYGDSAELEGLAVRATAELSSRLKHITHSPYSVL